MARVYHSHGASTAAVRHQMSPTWKRLPTPDHLRLPQRRCATPVLPCRPMDAPCPLCAAAERPDVLAANDHAVAFFDAFPISSGHALIVSRRHVADLFHLSGAEQAALWALLPIVKSAIDKQHAPTGYNVGVNVGNSAGQTVGHVHIHVIPRYDGDVVDPRGGIRWVIPGRADYWSPR